MVAVTAVPEPARTAQRSLVAALEVTALAAGAHVLAGGHLPSPVFLLGFGAVVLGAAALTLGRFLRVGVVVPFVLLAQVGLHAGVEATRPTHAAMEMAGGDGLLHTTPLMVGAHVSTSIVLAIVLLLQERVVAAVGTWLRPLVVVAARPAARRPVAPAYRGRRPRRALLRTSPRRGPPVLRAATP
jgi:hypothetical protein